MGASTKDWAMGSGGKEDRPGNVDMTGSDNETQMDTGHWVEQRGMQDVQQRVEHLGAKESTQGAMETLGPPVPQKPLVVSWDSALQLGATATLNSSPECQVAPLLMNSSLG